MPTKTTDLFEVEHIEYVADRSVDEVASALEEATGDVTDGKYASEVASAKDTDDFEARARWFEADSGFMRFLTLNDRGFLTLMGITGNRTEGSQRARSTTRWQDVVDLVVAERRLMPFKAEAPYPNPKGPYRAFHPVFLAAISVPNKPAPFQRGAS